MASWQPLPPTLRVQAVRSGFVQIGGQLFRFALGIGSGIAFARLLTPEDFGLLAIANSFILLVNMFRDMGLQKAAVHHPALDNQALSALFWLNLKLSAVVLLFMAAMAWPLSIFYRDSRLTLLILVLAAGVVALNLATQPESLLVRQMRFKTISGIEILSMVTGIGVGLALAWNGYGYWALAGQILTSQFTRSAAIWIAAGWRPLVGARSAELSSLLQYGGYHAGYRTLNYLSHNLDRIILGRIGGIGDVGVYNNAYRWANLPLAQLYNPLLDVAVSTFSRLQDNSKAYRRAAQEALLPLFSVTFPLFLFMAAAAKPIITFVFGEKWLEAIPLFSLFALAALANSLVRITDWIYLSSGTTKRQFQWSLVAAPVLIAGILLGTPWGTLGIAIGFTVASWALIYPGLRYCFRNSPLTMRDYADILWRPAGAGLIATLVYILLGRIWESYEYSIVLLLMQATVFGIVYGLAWLLFPGRQQAIESLTSLLHELYPAARRKTKDAA